jgi:hypothetical protein
VASLMELLFDTMPLDGAITKVRREYAAATSAVLSAAFLPIGELALGGVKAYLSSYQPVELSLLKHEAEPTPEHMKGEDWTRARPVWSYDASESFTTMKNLDCRSPSEDFRRIRVLESVSFGSEDANGSFTNQVEVTLEGHGKRQLVLSEAAQVASFLVGDGVSGPDSKSLWNTPANHEYGILHAFLYEVDPGTGLIREAADISDPELDVFRDAVERLSSTSPTDPSAQVRSVMTDDVWRLPGLTPTVVTVGLDQMLGGMVAPALAAAQGSIKELQNVPQRIVVCLFLSLHKAGDDYTPGGPAWGARAYPVIMVRSTHALAEVRAGIKLVRP